MTSLPTLRRHKVVLTLRSVDIEEDRGPSAVLAAVLMLLSAKDPVVVDILLDREPVQSDAEWVSKAFEQVGSLAGGPDIELSGPRGADGPEVLLSVPVFGDARDDARSVALLTGLAKGFDSSTPQSTQAAQAAPPDVPSSPFADAQQAVAEARRQHDARWSRSGTGLVRVAIVVQHPTTWGALAPIAEAGALHPRVDLHVVASETSLNRGAADVEGFVRSQGYEPRDTAWYEEHCSSVDVAVVVDPYDEFRPPVLHLPQLLRHGVRVVYSPYAENIGGGRESLSRQYDAGLHRFAWRAFMPTREQVELFAQHCSTGGAAALTVGAVKGDWLLAASEDAADVAALQALVAGRPAVLWNPHFTLGEGGLSTFLDYASLFLEHFERHPDQVLIARPHFRLLGDLERAGGAAADVATRFRRRCAAAPNVVLDEAPDYRAAFRVADVLISDLSSLIPEWLLLGKPAHLLERTDAPPTVADGTWRHGVSVVRGAQELVEALATVTRAHPLPGSWAARGAGTRVVDVVVGDYLREVWNA